MRGLSEAGPPLPAPAGTAGLAGRPRALVGLAPPLHSIPLPARNRNRRAAAGAPRRAGTSPLVARTRKRRAAAGPRRRAGVPAGKGATENILFGEVYHELESARPAALARAVGAPFAGAPPDPPALRPGGAGGPD